MSNISTDYSSVWANGIKESGWYMAKAVWDKSYASHLRGLGYEVERRIPDPNGQRAMITVPDDWCAS